MAHRNLLHKSKLVDFKRWCESNGVQTRDGRGNWQVLQVRVGDQWHVLYERLFMPEHLTVPEPLYELARAYVRMSKIRPHIYKDGLGTWRLQYSPLDGHKMPNFGGPSLELPPSVRIRLQKAKDWCEAQTAKDMVSKIDQ